MEILKKILTYGLLVFVVVSIVVAFVKHSKTVDFSEASVVESGSYIAVYYMHSSFRCSTCNTIEQMTLNVLNNSYAVEMQEGLIHWKEVDFQVNVKLANQFEVVASCVVVADVVDGEIVNFRRLDEVWTLVKEPLKFDMYISDAIDSYLKESK
ncbi:MAG: nitrophenyl compound nitroreductase subunit ArsF family protein [Kiritimatiellae bacterium]|jgi:hypothetical protein|nr:nitrophenyl compound nitroreductase subunit ArsF family protein [Kiritimatiellia bacterium]